MDGYVFGVRDRALPSGYGFIGLGAQLAMPFSSWASVKLIQGVLAEKYGPGATALVCTNSTSGEPQGGDAQQEGVVFLATRVSAVTADVLPLVVVQTREEAEGLKNWIVVRSGFGTISEGVYSSEIGMVSLPRVSLDSLDTDGNPLSPVEEAEKKVAQIFADGVEKSVFGPLGQFTLTFRRSSFSAQYTEGGRMITARDQRGPDDPCAVYPVVITAQLSRVQGGVAAVGSKFLSEGYQLVPIEAEDTPTTLRDRIKGGQQDGFRQGDLEALGRVLEVVDQVMPVPGPWNFAVRSLRYLYDRAFGVRS